MTDEQSKPYVGLLALLSLVVFLGACLNVAAQTPTQAHHSDDRDSRAPYPNQL
jgi:hypothetical protein